MVAAQLRDQPQRQCLGRDDSQQHRERIDRRVRHLRPVRLRQESRERQRRRVGRASGDQAAEARVVQLEQVPGERADEHQGDGRDRERAQEPAQPGRRPDRLEEPLARLEADGGQEQRDPPCAAARPVPR